MTRYADLAGTELVATSTYAYSGGGLLEALSHAQGATVLAAFSWTHTAAGLVASATTTGAGTAAYSYDAAGQLTGVAGGAAAGADSSYAYDAGGNRAGAGYATAAGGEQSAGAGWTYEYDAEGNRTRKVDTATGASADYRWDYRGRLVGADTRDAAGNVTSSVAFAYDALNQRIAKVARDGAGNVVSEEHYVLVARDLAAPGVSGGLASQAGLGDLELVLGAGGGVRERYAYGAGVDEVLAVEVAGGGTRWLLADDLGSVRAEVTYDTASGHAGVVRVVAYDAFGGVASDTSPGLKSRFGYTGREVDAETGLQFNRARYYDAATGRWVSRDPKGFAAGDANLYRYVGNGPTGATDPTGLEWYDWVNPLIVMKATGRLNVLVAGAVEDRARANGLDSLATAAQAGKGLASVSESFADALNPNPVAKVYQAIAQRDRLTSVVESHILAGGSTGVGVVKAGAVYAGDLVGVTPLVGAVSGNDVVTGKPLTLEERVAGGAVGLLQLALSAFAIRAGVRGLKGAPPEVPVVEVPPAEVPATKVLPAEVQVEPVLAPAAPKPELPLKPPARGNAHRPKSPDSKPFSPDIEPGDYVFVRDRDGVVHVLKETEGHLHATILGGKESVSGAGGIKVGPGGKILEIDNASGTFKFKPDILEQVKEALRQQGANVDGAVLKPFKN